MCQTLLRRQALFAKYSGALEQWWEESLTLEIATGPDTEGRQEAVGSAHGTLDWLLGRLRHWLFSSMKPLRPDVRILSGTM
jgi:hypothetical protein